MTCVGVVGSSARAAVHSLVRAGFSAWAVDQFADRDLKRVATCAVCALDGYPDAIPELAAQFPPGPVLYTGGLENHPHILRELAAQRPLWGNSADVVKRVRDPFVLFPALAECGFAVPRLIPRGEPCVREGRWLRKPLRSGGGLGIRVARPGEPASPHHYFQEFINGVPMSAIFMISSLVGVTRQLVGEPWLHAPPFGYCGNIGPLEVPSRVEKALMNAFVFNRTASLCGLWGIDFVLNGESVSTVEVNPRYTASVEVLEHAWRYSYLEAQADSFRRKCAMVKLQQATAPVGKAIYYAPHTFRFPHSGPWDADLAGDFDPWRLPTFADIPEAGSVIEAGHPVLTFFATGSTPAEVRERLQSRAAELDLLFQGCTP